MVLLVWSALSYPNLQLTALLQFRTVNYHSCTAERRYRYTVYQDNTNTPLNNQLNVELTTASITWNGAIDATFDIVDGTPTLPDGRYTVRGASCRSTEEQPCLPSTCASVKHVFLHRLLHSTSTAGGHFCTKHRRQWEPYIGAIHKCIANVGRGRTDTTTKCGFEQHTPGHRFEDWKPHRQVRKTCGTRLGQSRFVRHQCLPVSHALTIPTLQVRCTRYRQRPGVLVRPVQGRH